MQEINFANGSKVALKTGENILETKIFTHNNTCSVNIQMEYNKESIYIHFQWKFHKIFQVRFNQLLMMQELGINL